ncbi:GNAT family N-acetyltransferase [Gordonia shandongensis]|uniref:GNAT family N-acetyltransferase n=1 Tax=Gordonia shandongensis TaxID=376351 RepID=UPI0012EB89F6|nr:GNAT family N-acetyltransferase [Gordonia shandongensis]
MTTQHSPVVVATTTDVAAAADLARIAAQTFPLACPPHSTPENIAAHIAGVLSEERFAAYLSDPRYQVLTAAPTAGGPPIGYSLLVHDVPEIPEVFEAVAAMPGGADALAQRTVTEISKMYVLPDYHAARHSGNPSHELMAAALHAARHRGSTIVWLGVHSGNERAKRYYAKMGFTQIGTKSFDMNGAVEHDFVLGQRL